MQFMGVIEMIRLDLEEHEAKVLLEALMIQLRSTKDSGRCFLTAIRERLATAVLEE